MGISLQPTRTEYDDCIFGWFFLVEMPADRELWLGGCVKRAYLDFCRTLHGVGEGLYEKGADVIMRALGHLRGESAHLTRAEQFDE